jgi:hypothetical protein
VNGIILSIVQFIVLSALVYFIIAFVAILVGKPAKQIHSTSPLSFDELQIDYSNMPELEYFPAKDDEKLAYYAEPRF